MKFDLILTNPPFQDTVNRKKTPHKLWIDFTLSVFSRLIKPGGSLVQVSPASFASPSNRVLSLMGENQTHVLRVGTEHHFPEVGSTFSDYWIEKSPNDERPTRVITSQDDFSVELNSEIFYLPNDISEYSLSIHQKVMFANLPRLTVEWDYVSAHNVRRYDPFPSLVETQDETHPHPVFHTNRSTWYSSIRQDWADDLKVMWTRSGYTLPFFDSGVLGGTDMVYFTRVSNRNEGEALAANMNLKLMKYIYKTAKWSGFGNERVFTALPDLPRERSMTDKELFDYFGLTREEVNYVQQYMEPVRRKTK